MNNELVQVGRWNKLEVLKKVDFGLYLQGGKDEILLPKRYVPRDAEVGDTLEVFVYHDNEGRLIATTDKPVGQVGDIVAMEVVSTTPHGAFLKWGIMKDVFIAKSQQVSRMVKGGRYIVYIYIDQMTGRVAATEKFNAQVNNDQLTVREMEEVDLLLWRETEIGYSVIVNSKHVGLLHFSDIFRDFRIGDKVRGYIKHIRPDNKLDIGLGQSGYKRVEGEGDKVMRLLDEHDGYLPYHDKSDPEEIYEFFGMSKKTFKMTIGALYKQGKVELTQTGIKKVAE